MDMSFLMSKYDYYMNRMKEAQNTTELHYLVGQLIVVMRLQARQAMYSLDDAMRNERSFARMLNKAKYRGVEFPMGKKYLESLSEQIQLSRKNIIAIGVNIMVSLELWRDTGATFRDLCNLCCVDHDKALSQIPETKRDGAFGDLVSTYALGYKQRRDSWNVLDFIDCPMVYAIQEAYFSQIGVE